MVEVTRLNGQRMVLNGDLIERIEAIPDTILSLTNGRKIFVRESVREMVKKLLAYRRSLLKPSRRRSPSSRAAAAGRKLTETV